MSDRFDDALSPLDGACGTLGDGGVHVFVPDARRDPPREFRIDPRTDVVLIDIADVDVLAETAWLERKFPRELVALREAYGASNVSVRWGYLNVIR